jgi:hypothetical protein
MKRRQAKCYLEARGDSQTSYGGSIKRMRQHLLEAATRGAHPSISWRQHHEKTVKHYLSAASREGDSQAFSGGTSSIKKRRQSSSTFRQNEEEESARHCLASIKRSTQPGSTWRQRQEGEAAKHHPWRQHKEEETVKNYL